MTWTLQPVSELAAMAPQWDRLQQSLNHAAFLESHFLLPLLAEFGTGQEVLALRHENGELIAGAIMQSRGLGRWESFQPSQLPLGALISKHALDEQELRAMLRLMPGFPVSLGLTQLDSLLMPRPQDMPGLRTQDYIETAWLEVSGSFDAYWEARGKNLRQNAKKQRNKLAAEAVETRLECITEPAEVAAAMRDYGDLESAGWKAADGTAVHPDNAQGRFYRKMLENFCALGRARIFRYRFGDKVVAMDLCICSGPVLIILKTAYDESYKTVSPSTLMRQQQFEHLFGEAQVGRIEFYGKVMEWHTRWTELARPIYHLTQYRWPVLDALHRRLQKRGQAPATDTHIG